jgi:hypothetical protein
MTTTLITGASAGIGAAFARRLAADGHDLVLVARDFERLTENAAGLHDRYGVDTEVLSVDLSTSSGIELVEERLADSSRPVELLVNNAGFEQRGLFLDAPIEDEMSMLKVHCEAVLRLTSTAVREMRARGHGSVVNVSSTAAVLSLSTYGASKAWVVRFTLGVAHDTTGSGVRLMALCPGLVRTEFHERAGISTEELPRQFWMDADTMVALALRDLSRGKSVCVPGTYNKLMVAAGKVAPRALLAALSSKTRMFAKP